MKQLLTALLIGFVLFSTVVAAHMMYYGSNTGAMPKGMYGTSLFGLLYFALASFVFSAIFWWTHNWLVKDKKR